MVGIEENLSGDLEAVAKNPEEDITDPNGHMEIIQMCTGIHDAVNRGINPDVARAYFATNEGKAQSRRRQRKALKAHNRCQTASAQVVNHRPYMQGLPPMNPAKPKKSEPWYRRLFDIFGE